MSKPIRSLSQSSIIEIQQMRDKITRLERAVKLQESKQFTASPHYLVRAPEGGIPAMVEIEPGTAEAILVIRSGADRLLVDQAQTVTVYNYTTGLIPAGVVVVAHKDAWGDYYIADMSQVYKGIVGSTTAAGMTGLVSIAGVSYSATNHSNCPAVPGDLAFVALQNGERFYTLCKCCTASTDNSCCELSLTFCIGQQEEIIPVAGGYAIFDVSDFCSYCILASLKITLACNVSTGAITGVWELTCDGIVTTGSIAEDLDLLCDPDNDVTLDGLISSADCSLAFVAGNITGICVALDCEGDYCKTFQDCLGGIGVSCVGEQAILDDARARSVLSGDTIDLCEGVPYTVTYTVENQTGVALTEQTVSIFSDAFFVLGVLIAYTPANPSFVSVFKVEWTRLAFAIDEVKTFTATFMPGEQCQNSGTSMALAYNSLHPDQLGVSFNSGLKFGCTLCADCNCIQTPEAPQFMVFNNYPTEVAAVTGFSITIEAVTTTFGPRQTWDLRATVLSTSLSAQTLDQLNMSAPVLGIPTTATGATIVGGGQTSRWASQAFAPGETKIFTTTFTNLSLGCPGAAAAFATVEAIHGASTAEATAEYRCV